MTTPTLESERLLLTELGPHFLNDMFEYSRLPEFYKYLEFVPHLTLDDTRRYLEKLLARVQEEHALYWGICVKNSGKLIGTFGLVSVDKDRKSGCIGFGIGPNYWNQGFFKEALFLVVGFCFNELRLNRISSLTASRNEPSIRGLQGVGFRIEGCLRSYYRKSDGEYFDAVVLGLLRDDHSLWSTGYTSQSRRRDNNYS